MTEKSTATCMLGAPGKDFSHAKEKGSSNMERSTKKYPPADSDDNEQPTERNMDQNQNAFLDSRDMPREVDLFGEDNVEDILEMIDNLRASIEQLQMHCEKLASEKSNFEQALIDKEREHQVTTARYQEELSCLRKVNLQLVQKSRNSSVHADIGDLPAWLKDAFDVEQLHNEKINAEEKSESLRLAVMERDKIISNLEWQVVDSEATITSLQAERDKIAFELDYNLAREQEELEMLGAVGENYADTFLYGPSDGCSAGYADAPQHSRKPPQRDFSDASETEEFGGDPQASWSDSRSRNDFGAGRLKRSTNFNNINDLDECEDYDDDNQSMLSDYVGEANRDLELPATAPFSKLVKNKWQSFGSDSGEWHDVNKRHNPIVRVSSVVSDLCTRKPVSKSKELSRPQLVKQCIPKDNDPCQSPPSVKITNSTNESQADLWSFTPDSILNVTTGEEISTPESPQKIGGRFAEMYSPVQNAENHESFATNEICRTEHEQKDSEGSGFAAECDSLGSADVAGDTAKRKQPTGDPRQHNRILEEYQKWKVTGRKGDPPSKLKISQC